MPQPRTEFSNVCFFIWTKVLTFIPWPVFLLNRSAKCLKTWRQASQVEITEMHDFHMAVLVFLTGYGLKEEHMPMWKSHISQLPYKHSTSGPLAGPWRTATPWQPASIHPLGGTGVVCKVGCWQSASGRPPLSLPFYPLGSFCVYWCSASLVLAAISRHQAATLSTSVAQGQLPA